MNNIKLTKKQKKNIKKMLKSLIKKKILYCSWFNDVQLQYSTKKNNYRLIHWGEVILRYRFDKDIIKEMTKFN